MCDMCVPSCAICVPYLCGFPSGCGCSSKGGMGLSCGVVGSERGRVSVFLVVSVGWSTLLYNHVSIVSLLWREGYGLNWWEG